MGTRGSEQLENTKLTLGRNTGRKGVTVLRLKAIVAIIALLFIAGCTGSNAEDFYTEAHTLFENGDYSGAIVLYKNALEKNAEMFDARFELAKAYGKSGKARNAENEFQKCYRLKPNNPELALEMARFYIGWTKPQPALEHLQRYIDAKGANAETYELQGLAQFINREPQKAQTSFEQSLNADSSRASARIALCRALIAQNQLAAAQDQVDVVLNQEPENQTALHLAAHIIKQTGSNEDIIAAYKTITDINPKDQYAQYEIGNYLLKNGNIAKASEQSTEMHTRFGDNYLTSMLDGMIAYQEQRYEDAVTKLQHSVSIRPTLEGYFKLALALYANGDLETALSQLQVVLDTNPDAVRASELASRILLQQQRTDDSIRVAKKALELDPANANIVYTLGNAYLAKGDNNLARSQFTNAIAIDPQNAGAHLKKGLILASEGDDANAEAGLEKAVELAEQNIEARLALFNFHISRMHYDEAEAVLKEGLAKSAATPEIAEQQAPLYNELGRLYSLQGKSNAALDAFIKAKESDPSFAPAYFRLSRLYISRGELDNALNELDALQTRFPKAIEVQIARAALLDLMEKPEMATAQLEEAKATGSPQVYEIMAGRLVKTGDVSQALALLNELPVSRATAQLAEMKAALYTRENQLDNALATLNELEKHAPQRAMQGKYSILIKQKKYDEALALAKDMYRRFPNDIRGAVLISRTLYISGKRQEAMTELENAYRHSPSPVLLMAQAELCVMDNRIDKAIAFLETCIQRDGSYTPAHARLADIHLRKGDTDKALKLYAQAIESGPVSVAVLNNYALLQAKTGQQPERALQMALSAYYRTPTSPAVLDTLGVALLANNRLDEARRTLERAVTLQPDSSTTRFHLAQAYVKSGDSGRARLELEKALSGEQFFEADEAKQLYASLK